MYAFSENFVLPLSHDEVVHGKGSLLGRMPGDDWQRFGNLRLLLAAQHAQPGKKLLFMGGEIAQRAEWSHDRSLDWHLLASPAHEGVRLLVRDLNRLHAAEPALHEQDCEPGGFEWIDGQDAEHGVVSFVRWAASPAAPPVLAVFNFTPVPRLPYRIGAPRPGRWDEILNTDAEAYGGSGWGNYGGVETRSIPAHGRAESLELALPPLGALFLRGPAVRHP
jgi:1,4-alpha-glucan branching enzyme